MPEVLFLKFGPVLPHGILSKQLLSLPPHIARMSTIQRIELTQPGLYNGNVKIKNNSKHNNNKTNVRSFFLYEKTND